MMKNYTFPSKHLCIYDEAANKLKPHARVVAQIIVGARSSDAPRLQKGSRTHNEICVSTHQPGMRGHDNPISLESSVLMTTDGDGDECARAASATGRKKK